MQNTDAHTFIISLKEEKHFDARNLSVATLLYSCQAYFRMNKIDVLTITHINMQVKGL
jgi:hypothetical protein